MGTLFFILSVVLVLALKVFRWKPGFLGKPESILGDRKKNAVLSLTTIIPSLLISTVLTSKVIARSEWFGHYFEKMIWPIS
ncbi:MAG: hypothetical protein CL840_14210 [Crocinitomicaceae bacterium]|nr:hypothetical protein [Crocinitomicaceae bacterium]